MAYNSVLVEAIAQIDRSQFDDRKFLCLAQTLQSVKKAKSPYPAAIVVLFLTVGTIYSFAGNIAFKETAIKTVASNPETCVDQTGEYRCP